MKTLTHTGELHAMSSGLKALCSEMAASSIETCRRAAGGHGYLLMSGLPRLYATTVAACTYEGENTVLYLQTARYLLKCLPNKSKLHIEGEIKVRSKKQQKEQEKQEEPEFDEISASGTSGGKSNYNLLHDDSLPLTFNNKLIATEYLRSYSDTFTINTDNLQLLLDQVITYDTHAKFINSDTFIDTSSKIITILLEAFRATCRRCLFNARDKIAQLTSPNNDGQSISYERAWILTQIDLIKAAKTHLLYLLLNIYTSWINNSPDCIRLILTRLQLLLFYTIVMENQGDFLLSGIKEEQFNTINEQIKCLLQLIRPDAVALVDAFDFHDVVLMSTLGK